MPIRPVHNAYASTVLTTAQREIFDKVKAFIAENRNAPSPSHQRAARLAMRNDFPARDRKFISTLADDLHLTVRWDEYDDDDMNLVTWRLPGALDDMLSMEEKQNGTPASGDDAGDGEWEDVDAEGEEDDDEESRAAVDRVLKKYEKAHVAHDDEGGGFDARHASSVKEKMDEWKRGYYRVSLPSLLITMPSD